MTKTKKRLIITFSIIGALVVLLIVFGAFFSLRSINVDVIRSISRVEAYNKEEIIESSGIKKGKNIMFLNFDKATETLEKKYPYAKFEFVRTFPNKLTIRMSERVPIFRIDVGGVWQIYDEELKCLEIVTTPMLADNNLDKVPVLSIKSGHEFSPAQETGERVNNSAFQSTIMAISGGIIYGANSEMSVMSDITLEYNDNIGKNITTFTIRETGTKIVVQGTSYFHEKLAYGLLLYLRDIRQYNPAKGGPNHTGHLDKVTITVFDAFNPDPDSEQIKAFSVVCNEEHGA